MRIVSVALLALGAAMIAQPAAAIEYPWCADYFEDTSGTNCGFSTLAQCQVTVHGVGGQCRENLFYQGPVAEPMARPRQKKRAPRRER